MSGIKTLLWIIPSKTISLLKHSLPWQLCQSRICVCDNLLNPTTYKVVLTIHFIQLQKVGRSGSMLHGYQITVLIKEWHGKVSLSPSRWCSLVWALIHLPEISAIMRLKSGLEGWVLWKTLEVVDIFPVAPCAHLSTSMYPPMWA